MTREDLISLLRDDAEVQRAVGAAFSQNLDRSLASQGKTSIGLEPDEISALLKKEMGLPISETERALADRIEEA